MRQTTALPTPRWSLGRRVFAGCRESLLDYGPSRHYLCHLCRGAWTYTPPCSSGAPTHFFPNDSGLTSRETRSAHGNKPRHDLLATSGNVSRLERAGKNPRLAVPV